MNNGRRWFVAFHRDCFTLRPIGRLYVIEGMWSLWWLWFEVTHFPRKLHNER